MEAGGNCAVVYSTLPRSSRSCAEGTLPGNYQVGRSHPVPEQSCSRARARIICQPSQAQRLSTGTNTLLSIPSDQTETRISIRQNQGFPPCPGGSDKPRAVSSTPSPIRHSAHLSGSPGPVAVRSRVPVSFLSGQDAAGQTRAPNPVLAPPAQRAPPKRNTLAPLPTQLSYIFYLLASSSPALPRLGSFFVFFFFFFSWICKILTHAVTGTHPALPIAKKRLPTLPCLRDLRRLSSIYCPREEERDPPQQPQREKLLLPTGRERLWRAGPCDERREATGNEHGAEHGPARFTRTRLAGALTIESREEAGSDEVGSIRDHLERPGPPLEPGKGRGGDGRGWEGRGGEVLPAALLVDGEGNTRGPSSII